MRSGAVLDVQDTVESSVTLQIATQKGVDLNFTSVDLTLSLDDFSKRILEPAMAALAANIEADAMSMYKDIYNQVNNIGAAATFAKLLAGRKILQDNLGPMTDRAANLNTQDTVDLVDALKGLFHDDKAVSKQYREGKMGHTAGFDFMENTLWPKHQTGTSEIVTAYLANSATAQTGSAIIVDTGANTLVAGDIVSFAGTNSVHPESKVSTGVAKTFTVVSATTTLITISPAIVLTGAKQNVSAAVADNAAVSKHGAASVAHGISMLYHSDAFAISFADLVMPKGVDFSAREVYDGISMRIARQWDITNDRFPLGTTVH